MKQQTIVAFNITLLKPKILPTSLLMQRYEILFFTTETQRYVIDKTEMIHY